MNKRWVGLIACLVLGHAQAASDDCGKAKTQAEKVVCEGHELSEQDRHEIFALDSELAEIYGEALRKVPDPVLLKHEQEAWLKAREQYFCEQKYSGIMPGWITDLYRDRIANLRYDLAHPPATEAARKSAALLSMASSPGGNFAIQPSEFYLGPGHGLCEALVRWFNHTTPKGKMKCPARIVRSTPGISEPDWVELDIRQHEALFVKLMQAWSVGGAEYFFKLRPTTWPTPEDIHARLEEARAGKYRMWMVKQDVDGVGRDGKLETIVMIQRALSDESCSEDGTWYVKEDLSELDEGKTRNSVGGAKPGAVLVHYKGRAYFSAMTSTGGLVSGDLGRHMTYLCQIDNYSQEGEKK